MKSTLYDILQIGEKASQEEIATMYRLRKERLENAGDHESQNELKLVQHAFEILSNQGQRARYDQRLTSGNTGGQQTIERERDGTGGITKMLVVLAVAVVGYMAYQKTFKTPAPSNAVTRESPSVQLDDTKSPKAPFVAEGHPVPPAMAANAEPVSQQSESQPQLPTAMPSLPQPELQAKPADINDVNAVPLPNPTTQRTAYFEFLSKSSPRAFLICNDNSVTTLTGNLNFINKKLAELSVRCTPYAIDDNVVWTQK